MDIQVIHLADETAIEAVKSLKNTLKDKKQPDFIALHFNSDFVEGGLHQSLKDARLTNVHAASSCLGVMTNSGTTTAAAFCITDPEGDFGTAGCAFTNSPASAAESATRKALENAGRSGEAPDLIWVSATPGCEEAMLTGIQSVVGKDTPVIGGSAADNAVAGNWAVLNNDLCTENGVVVSVLFPSTPINYAYQNGYAPTSNAGKVTKASGRRIFEIDDKPASTVYNEWTNGAIDRLVSDAPENILADATLWPLGREVADVSDVPYYLLAHPSAVHSDGSLDLFAEVSEGEIVTQMSGDRSILAERAGRVAEFSAKPLDNTPAGALMVYCGGCMLSVQDRLDTVVNGVNSALQNAPFLGVFTFGEQGPVFGSGNRHGNLMISCIAFSAE